MPEENNDTTADRELTNIRPSKVSLVDKGANGQFFFIAKSVDSQVDDNSLKSQLTSFISSTVSRVQGVRNWFDGVETDNDSEVPDEVLSILSRVQDETDLMVNIAKSNGTFLNDVKISGTTRDRMVAKLDVLTEKLIASSRQLSSEEDISDTFISKLDEVVSDFNIILTNTDDLQNNADEKSVIETEKSEGSQEEEEMSIKFVEIAKSAEKVDLDAVEIKKQVGAASAKLDEIMSSLNIDTTEAMEMDSWDLRWKMSEAIDILVAAAKLDSMLQSSVQMSADDPDGGEETDSSDSNVEKKEETPDSSDANIEKKETPVEKSVDNSVDVAALLEAAVSKAVTPLVERLDSIEKGNKESVERIEKMERARVAPKGGDADGTTNVEKKTEANESIFASIMPDHLRGTAKHTGE